MDERAYWLGFSVFPGIGPKRFASLLSTFTSAKIAWDASEEALHPILGKVLTPRFLQFRKTFSLELYLENIQKKAVGFFILTDKSYPKLLKQITLPPFVLYFRGDKTVVTSSALTIGVVGTRKATSYGRTVTELITEELVNAGCIIVSGLAMGVDAVAHKTTLEHKGKTIAVLGSGVDVCHPVANYDLYNSILASGGVVVSEYPLSALPSKGSFPSRNRIIAGLSSGVVVTEGAEDSGALITAADAFICKRQVFAVPGPITSSLSRGPNSLLLKGAKLITSGADILDNLENKGDRSERKDKARKKIRGETKEEQKIVALLTYEALSFDEIVKRMKSNAMTIGTVLSLMELKGMVIQTEGGYALRT